MVPVTVIQAGPCLVVQKKTSDKDGYDAVQIGLVEKISNRRVTSALRGHFEKAGVQPVRTVAEVPYSGDANVGDKVQVDMFKVGDSIDVVGQSKGKGFQGVVKRHHFAGGRATHGSMFHRAPGSIGASAFPSQAANSLLQALQGGGGPGLEGGARILLRAAVAALLNAAHPDVDYPRTTAQILADVNSALTSGNRNTMLNLATALDNDNNIGCPLN